MFLARDRALDQPVAVKVLDLASSTAIERFRREVRVLSQLSHPAIVRYITHGETDPRVTEWRELYLVTEFLEGETSRIGWLVAHSRSKKATRWSAAWLTHWGSRTNEASFTAT